MHLCLLLYYGCVSLCNYVWVFIWYRVDEFDPQTALSHCLRLKYLSSERISSIFFNAYWKCILNRSLLWMRGLFIIIIIIILVKMTRKVPYLPWNVIFIWSKAHSHWDFITPITCLELFTFLYNNAVDIHKSQLLITML